MDPANLHHLFDPTEGDLRIMYDLAVTLLVCLNENQAPTPRPKPNAGNRLAAIMMNCRDWPTPSRGSMPDGGSC